MSISVISSPHAVCWAKNRNEYRLQCNDLVSQGRVYVGGFNFSTIPPAGCHVVLSVDGRELVYSVVSSNPVGAYEVSSAAMLRSRLAGNYYITQMFDTNLSGNSVLIQGKSAGRHSVEIFATTADGVRDDSIWSFGLVPGDEGADEVRLDNYAVAVRLEVVVNDYNNLHTYLSEYSFLHPDDNGMVSVRLDALAGLIPQPDLPSANDAQWQLLTNAMVKFRISYGEVWGNPVPLVNSMVSESSYHFALCGEVADRFARLNLPDWFCANDSLLGEDDMFWILGEDSGAASVVRSGQKYYVYGMFHNKNIDAGTTRGVNLYVYDENGAQIGSKQFLALNGSVYRLDLSPKTLGVDDRRCFSVRISGSMGSWDRLFSVVPDMFDQQSLLLQSKYGVLLPWVVSDVRREVVVEADSMAVDRRRYLDVSEAFEVYTATTPYLSRFDARRMASCLAQQYHYLLCGSAWLRITIEPGTFLVRHEKDNMVRVEFQYRFVENQLENVTNGSLSRSGISATVGDSFEQVVSFVGNTDPNSNIIR